jgi:hypothetical protein
MLSRSLLVFPGSGKFGLAARARERQESGISILELEEANRARAYYLQ